MSRTMTSVVGRVAGSVLGICACVFSAPLLAANYYVARNGQTPGDFQSWGAAASNIQDAVNAAASKDTVWVGAGRYTVPTNAVVASGTNVVYINKSLTLRGTNSLVQDAIRGTLAPDAIIDGGGSNRGVYLALPINVTIVVDGFTITNCAASAASASGGGICMVPGNQLTTGLVQNCTISGNTAVSGGGGIAIPDPGANTSFMISNCVIRGNRASRGGGVDSGVRQYTGGRTTITRCLVENNTAMPDYGGGILNADAPFLLDSCVVRGNWAGSSGGGMHVRGGSSTLRNCLMYNNTACNISIYSYGGALAGESGVHALLNCTIVSNRAGANGVSGLLMNGQICNSIVCSNGVSGNDNAYGTIGYTNSCIGLPAVAGPGTITTSPAFVNFAGQDFHLSRSSPCLNTGTSQTWMSGAVDLDGNRRVDQGSLLVDMGCYEFVYAGGTIILVR